MVSGNVSAAATEQTSLGFFEEPATSRLLEFDADFTPSGVVLQQMLNLRHNVMWPYRPDPTILDPSAGTGVMGRCARMIWPEATIVGVEIREEEAMKLEDRYDELIVGAFQEVDLAKLVKRFGLFDIIVTNPPFGQWEDYWKIVLELVAENGCVSLLGLDSWGQRSESGYDLFEQSPPTSQYRVTGTINYRGGALNPKNGKPYGVDMRDYSWWTTKHDGLHRRGWHAENLPRLQSELRRWRLPTYPGCEPQPFLDAIYDNVLSCMGEYLPC